jgi:hypothetical protein
MGERPLVSSLLGSSRRFSQALGFAPPRPGAGSAGGSHALRNDADPRADLRALGSPGTIVLRGRTV